MRQLVTVHLQSGNRDDSSMLLMQSGTPAREMVLPTLRVTPSSSLKTPSQADPELCFHGDSELLWR